jgi:hypothetical protein
MDLESLSPLLGEWTVEAVFPGTGATGPAGTTTFELTLGGRYVVQRGAVDHPEAPDLLAVIAPDAEGEGFVQHYFDSRGVVRLYAMTFADGLWTLRRDAPDFSPLDFHQRFEGRLNDDGTRIDGHWDSSPDGIEWALDFDLIYRRDAR